MEEELRTIIATLPTNQQRARAANAVVIHGLTIARLLEMTVGEVAAIRHMGPVTAGSLLRAIRSR